MKSKIRTLIVALQVDEDVVTVTGYLRSFLILLVVKFQTSMTPSTKPETGTDLRISPVILARVSFARLGFI